MANVKGRESGVMLDRADPGQLLLVTDPDHPLYQRDRATKPPPEWFVESIRKNGVLVPIEVRRGPTVRGQIVFEVVDGRQRVLAARLVNGERKAAGLMPIAVACNVFRGEEQEAARLVAVLNEHRVPVDPMTRAQTAAQALKFGASEAQVCNDNNWTSADLRRHLDLLECVAPVQAAVQEGRIALRAVSDLRKLLRAEQAAAVEKFAETGKSGAREVKNAVQAEHPETRAPRMRSRKKIEAKIAELTGGKRSQVVGRGIERALTVGPGYSSHTFGPYTVLGDGLTAEQCDDIAAGDRCGTDPIPEAGAT